MIGYDKAQSNIGSFGGDFNGTIENCVSYADVYGTKYVGGISGNKGQSMGTYALKTVSSTEPQLQAEITQVVFPAADTAEHGGVNLLRRTHQV